MRFRYWAVMLLLVWIGFSAAIASAAPAVQATGVRWSRSADAITGLVKVRLILETSGPVEMEQFLTAVPNWRLIVTLKGSVADNLAIPASPDISVVTQMSVVKSAKDITRIIVDFPGALTQDQYKISTLPADPRAKTPFQVVIDMQKIVRPSDLKFLPGLRGKVITIDPGHGGSDPGAIGFQGSREKQLNLSVAMQVKGILEKAGAKVLMTRETDVDVFGSNATDREELQARAMVANSNRADVFLSIHHNASVNRDMNGTTTYYYMKTLLDVVLAQSLQETLVQAGGLVNIGVRPANFYVVKNTTMPAALVEIGFISNPQEEQTLNNPVFQQKIAQAIATGIDKFFIQAAKMRGEQ